MELREGQDVEKVRSPPSAGLPFVPILGWLSSAHAHRLQRKTKMAPRKNTSGNGYECVYGDVFEL